MYFVRQDRNSSLLRKWTVAEFIRNHTDCSIAIGDGHIHRANPGTLEVLLACSRRSFRTVC